jgi:hypothetical protein
MNTPLEPGREQRAGIPATLSSPRLIAALNNMLLRPVVPSDASKSDSCHPQSFRTLWRMGPPASVSGEPALCSTLVGTYVFRSPAPPRSGYPSIICLYSQLWFGTIRMIYPFGSAYPRHPAVACRLAGRACQRVTYLVVNADRYVPKSHK